MYVCYNANPDHQQVGDCTVRAVCTAIGCKWQEAYIGMCMEGLKMFDMPSANRVWGAYLRKNGFMRRVIDRQCPDCMTVREFCLVHPDGTFVLALQSHVVAVINGEYYDSWDSGDEPVLYYFMR